MCKVYSIRGNDGSIYTGWTTDVEHRLQMHNEGKGAKYTRGRGPFVLLCVWNCKNKSEALKLEARIKKMTRSQKLAYIEETKKNSVSPEE